MTTGPVLVTGAHGPAGRALMAQFDERGLPVLTPLIGQVFDADTETELWWEEV